jgi:thioredoxin-related protein
MIEFRVEIRAAFILAQENVILPWVRHCAILAETGGSAMRALKITALLAVLATPALGAEIGDDGLHKQPWFSDTFLDMGEDLAEATATGKDLMVLIEQNGCPYCREMHEVNFAREEISSFAAENFIVVQLDMWGSREVTDFDGETMEERDLMRKWGLSFTPTTMLFAASDPENMPETMFDARAFMLPGYFKPFHHLSAMEYVASDGYLDQPNFQRWLQAKAEHMEEQGEEVELWD